MANFELHDCASSLNTIHVLRPGKEKQALLSMAYQNKKVIWLMNRESFSTDKELRIYNYIGRAFKNVAMVQLLLWTSKLNRINIEK